jgi:hypothetical protein
VIKKFEEIEKHRIEKKVCGVSLRISGAKAYNKKYFGLG